MKFVSPEYQAQLDALAETLCTPERFGKPVGQLALFNVVEIPRNLTPVTRDDFIDNLVILPANGDTGGTAA